MKFAAAVNEKNLKAIIPLTLEEAAGLMIFESDNELDLIRDYVGGTGCGEH